MNHKRIMVGFIFDEYHHLITSYIINHKLNRVEFILNRVLNMAFYGYEWIFERTVSLRRLSMTQMGERFSAWRKKAP